MNSGVRKQKKCCKQYLFLFIYLKDINLKKYSLKTLSRKLEVSLVKLIFDDNNISL